MNRKSSRWKKKKRTEKKQHRVEVYVWGKGNRIVWSQAKALGKRVGGQILGTRGSCLDHKPSRGFVSQAKEHRLDSRSSAKPQRRGITRFVFQRNDHQ